MIRFPLWGEENPAAAPRRGAAAMGVDSSGDENTLPSMGLKLEQFEAVLLDLDGTIYHEEHALPGAVELIEKLRGMGKPFACLTNSTMSPEGISRRLRRMGVGLDPGDIYSAAAASADYVLKHFAGQRVFNLASEGMHDLLHGKVRWVEEPDEGCDVVVVGTPKGHYSSGDRPRTAMLMLRGGAAMVGLCADRVYPSPRGLEFGVGAAAAMLEYASGVKPVFCGKPEALFFKELCRRMGVEPGRCVLIGDNLESDVAGAKGVGMQTVLVLTGVSGRGDVEKLPTSAAAGGGGGGFEGFPLNGFEGTQENGGKQMSFRQRKSNRDAELREWRAWLDANQSALHRAGLPPSVTMSPSHWDDFLQNGYLEWHPESQDGFSLDRMADEQMAELLSVLEIAARTHPKFAEGPMAGWVRVRLRR